MKRKNASGKIFFSPMGLHSEPTGRETDNRVDVFFGKTLFMQLEGYQNRHKGQCSTIEGCHETTHYPVISSRTS